MWDTEMARWLGDNSETPPTDEEFATQGGGIAIYDGDDYIWKEPPAEFPEMRAGQRIPPDWGVTGPINR